MAHYITTVRSNDTLHSIAHRFTGDANRWNEIVSANPSLPQRIYKSKTGRPMATISSLFVGQNIKLPNHWFEGIKSGQTSGTIGCGSRCTAGQINDGTCKDFNLKQFKQNMGLSGPSSNGSLGCGGGGCGSTANTSHHGCASCGGQSNGCGYPFGPDQPGPIGNGCSSCSFDYLCDYPFDNGGSICPMPYGAFGGGANPNGVVNGPPNNGQVGDIYNNGQVGCGECGRSRGEFYLQGTVGDTNIMQGTVGDATQPTSNDITTQMQAFLAMNPADCEKQTATMLPALKQSDPTTYQALVTKYGSEDALNTRVTIAGQAFCGEDLKNINVQAPYKTTNGLLWLGGTLVGGIIAGFVVGKIL